MEGAEIVIELYGADRTTANNLRELFTDESDDVAFSHAFGGADCVIIITVLAKPVFDKLIEYWTKTRTFTPKTTVKIRNTSITIAGFGREDVETLLANPAFQNAVKAAKSK